MPVKVAESERLVLVQPRLTFTGARDLWPTGEPDV